MDAGADRSEVVDAGQDLRSALEAAFKEQKDAPVADTQSKAVDTSAAEVQAKAERARDEAGRFAKEQKAATEQVAKLEEPKPVVQAEIKTGEVKQEEKPTIAKVPAPPNGWSAEAKAKWHELPQEVVAAIAQREQDLGRAAGKMDEERATGRAVRNIAQPYMPILAAEGTTVEQAFASLMNTAYILRQGPQHQKNAAVADVIKQHNIDLDAVTQLLGRGGNSNSDNATQANPELLALRQEVAQLRGQFGSREAQEQQSLEARARQDLTAFESDPAHVHYNEVKADMAALLSAGRASDLKTAYDMACWARPEVRTSILAQQRAEEAAKQREADRQRAEEARRKAVSVTGAPGSVASGANAGSRSLREELEANMAAARGAV